MKLKKIMAAATASVLALGTMAVSASANFYVPEGLDSSLSVSGGSNGMWLIQLYNTGNPAENKPATDRGLDVTKVASMTAYIDIVPVDGTDYTDYDPSLDGFGGSMIWSANGGEIGSQYLQDEEGNFINEEGRILIDKDGNSLDEAGNVRIDKAGNVYDENGTMVKDKDGNVLVEGAEEFQKPAKVKNPLYDKYNWAQDFNSWWGLPEKDDTYEGRPADQVDENGDGGEATNIGTCSWTEKIHLNYIRRFGYSLTVNIPDDYRWPAGGGCYQVGLQEWGNNEYFLVHVVAYTIDDADGNHLLIFDECGKEIDDAKLKEIVDELSKPIVDEEGNPIGDGDAPANTNSGDAENTSAGDESTAAPSDSGAPVTTAAPASSGSSGLPVGAIVGIIAGVIVVIVVVVIVVMKKKK